MCLTTDIKICEIFYNPNRFFFRCPKRRCDLFEWWKSKDDKKLLSGNKWKVSGTYAREKLFVTSLFVFELLYCYDDI